MTVRERSGGAPLPGVLTGKASHELRLTGWPGRHRKGVRSFTPTCEDVRRCRITRPRRRHTTCQSRWSWLNEGRKDLLRTGLTGRTGERDGNVSMQDPTPNFQRPSINQTIGDGVGRSTWGAATRIHLTTSVYSQRHQRWVTKQGHRHNW